MFSLSRESKNTKVAILFILAIFLFSCIYASFYYNDKLLLGSLEKFDNDDVKYLRSAQTLLDTGYFTYNYPDKHTVFIMPGITLILTPFVAIFGMEGAIMPIRIFFAIIQTFNLYVIFLIARKMFNSKVGIISIVLSLLYLPNIYVSTIILTEPITYTCILLIIYMIMYGTETGKKRYFIAGGIIWGISVMFRPTMVAFPIAVLFYWLFKKVRFKDMVKFAVCAIIPLVIIMSPWVIRNYVIFDRFIPLTLSSGNPALQGTIIDYSKEEREKMYSIVKRDDLVYGDEIQSNEAETILAKRIFDYNIKNNTFEYIKWYTVGKTIKNFEQPFMWYPIYMNNTYTPINNYHSSLLHFFAVCILLMAVLRNKNPNAWFLVIIVTFFNCIHLPFYCFPRYVYPAMAMVIMLDSYIIYRLCSIIFKKRKKAVEFDEINTNEPELKKLIIIPAYNEEENIINALDKVRDCKGFDYIVINDGSVDKTENMLKNENHIKLVKNLGIGGAMQTGYKYALHHNYDIAVQIDADGQHNPEYLDKMIKVLLETKSDMVIGSRYIEKEGFQSTASRRFGKNILTFIIRLLTKKTITDPTSGFRACSKNAIRMFADEYPVDYPEPETVVQLLAAGRTVTEVPVLMNSREGGISSITPIKSVYYMIKVSISLVFSYFNNRKEKSENEC